ncbi:MAG: six-cysteine ranthipeptide SCIFF [Firmicutes bacterium]|nr:six-cysteine ranthipeptide SCIFF [Bacillota bacterium]
MKHIKKAIETVINNDRHSGCGECQTSCQSACKTSCTVGNQECLKEIRINNKEIKQD